MFNGRPITFADYGNINYVYTGTILGLSSKTLYMGAGYIQNVFLNDDPDQYYGDSELDFAYVRTGILWANQDGYKGHIHLPLKVIFSIREKDK